MQVHVVIPLILLCSAFFSKSLNADPVSTNELILILNERINSIKDANNGFLDKASYYSFYQSMADHQETWKKWTRYFQRITDKERKYFVLSHCGVLEIIRNRYGKSHSDDIELIVLRDNYELSPKVLHLLDTEVKLRMNPEADRETVTKSLEQTYKAVKSLCVYVHFFHKEFERLKDNQWKIYLTCDPAGHYSTVFLRKLVCGGITKYRATLLNSIDSVYSSTSLTEIINFYSSGIAISLAIAGQTICPKDRKIYLLPGCMQADSITCLQFCFRFIEVLLKNPIVSNAGYEIESWPEMPFSLWTYHFKQLLNPCYADNQQPSILRHFTKKPEDGGRPSEVITLNKEGLDKMPGILHQWYDFIFEYPQDKTKRPVFPNKSSPFRKLISIPEEMCTLTQVGKPKAYTTFNTGIEDLQLVRTVAAMPFDGMKSGTAIKLVNLTAYIEGMKTVVELLEILSEQGR